MQMSQKAKVRLLTSRCGPKINQSAGDIVEVDSEEAKRLIESGQAEPARDAEVERATSKRAKRPEAKK